MVCAVRSLADFFQPRNPRLKVLEHEFIKRRHSAERMLFDEDYFLKINFENLPDQLSLIRGLVLEAYQLDNEYVELGKDHCSCPISENLIVIYRGVRRKIQKEIKYRENQGA